MNLNQPYEALVLLFKLSKAPVLIANSSYKAVQGMEYLIVKKLAVQEESRVFITDLGREIINLHTEYFIEQINKISNPT